MEISPVSRLTPITHAELLERPTPVVDASLVAAVRAVNNSELLGDDRQLLFRRDRETGESVIQVIDRKTGDVLDQIPAEQVLRMLAALDGGGKRGVQL